MLSRASLVCGLSSKPLREALMRDLRLKSLSSFMSLNGLPVHFPVLPLNNASEVWV